MNSSYELLDQAKPRNEVAAVDDVVAEDEQDHSSRSDSARVSDATKIQYSTTIHRSNKIFLLVLIYATLAVFAWVVTCVLAYRPIHGNSYSMNAGDSHYSETTDSENHFHAFYLDNEEWYRAARVIQSIVAVLTIPLTSAVCGRAAVAFIQQPSHSGDMTMRQTMVLADKGWADVGLISKVLRGQWKRYGSSFLAVAILLNILGAIISPLQQILLTTETIKIPTQWTSILGLMDMSDHGEDMRGNSLDDYTVALTRSRLSSTTLSDVQARLWSGSMDCSGYEYSTLGTCQAGGSQNLLSSLHLMQDPFFAELPSGYSTGLLSQFLPRVNSTASRELIDIDDFPPECSSDNPDVFYVTYSNSSEDRSQHNRTASYNVEVCMPGNMSEPAWSGAQHRQNCSEELYLKISLWNVTNFQSGVYSSKITLNTTVGYFELPNYANGGVAGPLLEKTVSEYIGPSWVRQNTIQKDTTNLKPGDESTDSGTAVNATAGLISNYKKGPLLIMAMALFGLGSFLDVVHDQEAFLEAHRQDELENENECIATVPFLQLTKTLEDDEKDISSLFFKHLDPCLQFSTDTTNKELDAVELAAEYLWMFVFNRGNGSDYSSYYVPAGDVNERRIVNAFEAAAFITNEVWMVDNFHLPYGKLVVNYDMGEDTQKPSISLGGIVVISILLCLDLLSLAALALYSARVPRWTEQLDSLAMMRLGAVMADELPLQVASKSDRISILDEMPGCIGDATGGEGTVGELGIGAKTPLHARRRYTCYEGDHESEDAAQKHQRH
ncbi:hypothetical protein PFICI_14658 [Pestalotiopsis fici W106-1]|uniref:Uncharacterized protein n=1 Tax=Pestalotiopsis fici (strain W106-1 / CGMCC3.15140) TaxID=1229662 RepID=W3WKM7_PESFW|nr:uncharacterized protein PFICI_14658 [Pestalotiopsis fici W106-1]ETS73712.1 hypothetical protein PFICI_14658 [Pestalotiopsis fici W106-1]